MRGLSLVGSIVLLASLSCKGKSTSGDKQAPPSTSAVRGPATPAAGTKIAQKASVNPGTDVRGRRRSIGQITVEEVESLVSAPKGALAATPLRKITAGARIDLAYCALGADPRSAADELSAHLAAIGWQKPRLRMFPKDSARLEVHSLRPPYRLTALVRAAGLQECEGTKGQQYVTLGVYKLQPRQE